jgi:hypothetical protein
LGCTEIDQDWLHPTERLAAMSSSLKVPTFAAEAEEADWWYENRPLVEAEINTAFAEGRMKRGIPAPRGITPATSIRLDPADIEKARAVAAKRGLKYQTYLKMLIHEALEKESVA